MKTDVNYSAVTNKEIKKIMDNIRNEENSPFVLEIYKYLRKLKESKLKNNIVVYDKDDFLNLGFKDKAISRLVTRFEDIMLCVDVYEKYDDKKIIKNMMVFADVIRKVAANIDLDRVIVVRIFKKGNVDRETGFKVERGYLDKYREFNEDILDLLTISLEELDMSKDTPVTKIMQYWH